MARFCTYCGNPVEEDARFCRNCGRQLPKRPVRPETREAPKQAVMMPIFPDLAASSSAGEFITGELTLPGMSGRAEPVPETLPPVSGLLHSIGSLFGGVVSLFRKPSALIGTLPLAVLWFVLAQFRDSDSMIVRILSWFTYAGGGFDRPVLGTAHSLPEILLRCRPVPPIRILAVRPRTALTRRIAIGPAPDILPGVR